MVETNLFLGLDASSMSNTETSYNLNTILNVRVEKDNFKI